MDQSDQSSQGPDHGGQPSPQGQPDYSQPVAYDQQGNPLYARPPANYTNAPQMVYMSRPLAPPQPQIPPRMQKMIEESRLRYPNLNLSDGEYIISAVRRHPIGLLQIWAVVAFLMLLFGGLFIFFFFGGNAESFTAALGSPDEAKTAGILLVLILYALFVLGGMAATYIYQNNRFYLTNESVIQEIQTTLFSKHEQTVSLSNIEDASYRQNGFLPTILNYGTIRLSTEGDETTYRFSYVANPKKHIAVLNNAVEAFKNGRPVDLPNQDQPS